MPGGFEDFIRQRPIINGAGQDQSTDQLGHRGDGPTPPRRFRSTRDGFRKDVDQRLEAVRKSGANRLAATRRIAAQRRECTASGRVVVWRGDR